MVDITRVTFADDTGVTGTARESVITTLKGENATDIFLGLAKK